MHGRSCEQNTPTLHGAAGLAGRRQHAERPGVPDGDVGVVTLTTVVGGGGDAMYEAPKMMLTMTMDSLMTTVMTTVTMVMMIIQVTTMRTAMGRR